MPKGLQLKYSSKGIPESVQSVCSNLVASGSLGPGRAIITPRRGAKKKGEGWEWGEQNSKKGQ